MRYNPTTSATRIPLLANGTIDLECGNTTNKEDRHKFVSFAPTTFLAQVVVVARKDGGVDPNNLATFKGKSIAAQAGGQTFAGIPIERAGQPGHHHRAGQGHRRDLPDGRIRPRRGHDERRRPGLRLGGLVQDPSAFVIGTKGYELAPYGIMQPKDDPAFKKVVDGAVLDMIKNGKVAALYEKYFNSPIPPKQINLKYPMSDAFKRALANPTDSGDPKAYE